MSQRFNPKMEEMRQSNPASPSFEAAARICDDDLYYASFGNVRHICFTWPEGKKMFLNYAYLISGEYDAGDNSIGLIFSTHTVVVRGVNLQAVFFKIMNQEIRLLESTDARYNSISSGHAVVNDIQVTINKSG